MHTLVTNSDIELAIQFMQTLPGSFPENILHNGSLISDHVEVKQISDGNREMIIELRLGNATVTAHCNEGNPCHSCSLFPDYEKDIPMYTKLFNQYYEQTRPDEWQDTEKRLLIRLTDDEDVGYMISLEMF